MSKKGLSDNVMGAVRTIFEFNTKFRENTFKNRYEWDGYAHVYIMNDGQKIGVPIMLDNVMFQAVLIQLDEVKATPKLFIDEYGIMAFCVNVECSLFSMGESENE